MESKIIDSDQLFFNAQECTRLSYEMLFKEPARSPRGNGTNRAGNGHAGQEKADSGNISEEQFRKKELEWRQKLEEARETAYRQGLEKGKKAGYQHAMETLEDRLAPMKQALKEIDGHISDLMDELKPYIATMVFDLAGKVIGLPVKSEKLKERVAGEIRGILEALESEVNAKITIARDDYELVSQAIDDLAGSRRIGFSVSEELNPGEYTVDTCNEHIVRNFRKMLNDFRERVALTADHNDDREDTA